ncbi:PilZ domain-containing protein [Sphingomonas sp. NFR04]|uniref:PilZ domain-containing protein n=1 Tax=unclassified Sphingomonas TaxID=196159 RepID=UPI0008E13E22|nr:PilZ domain-containing protein [Sphingomonas sp. NFR04]SFJ67632.1 PilZ domain-containing protein [Sphingomonas sp. NFR04]
MSVTGAKLASADDRLVHRDEVEHRTRAVGPDARPVAFLIVNVSPQGLMARCEAPFEAGDLLRIQLPVVGEIGAEVRWALGGRVGCQFLQPIASADYVPLVAALRTR